MSGSSWRAGAIPEASGNGLRVGDVVFALFPAHRPGGYEQEGMRPAVVVGLPERLGEPCFGVLIVAPMTTDRGLEWAERSPTLYPRFPEGTANLRSPSICLLDQVRSLDASRVRRYRGSLNRDQYRPVHQGLRRIFTDIREDGNPRAAKAD